MTDELPRIDSVSVTGPLTVSVTWKSGGTAQINLAGWIATGGDLLAALNTGSLFGSAHAAEYGTSIAWGEDDELMIDAEHLRLLAEEQAPIDISEWQAQARLSNQEAAELLGVSLSTWNAYKAAKTGKTPKLVDIALRAALRDPLIMQAHFRPRKAGRPRKDAAA
ncbi:hypothetical protein ACMDCR_13140 [Labrys okinawensis]|uniref:hypothetical protein n=1 Tax=Labrys okinawensis TaxID=346911 RepID=UPI0039BD659A